MDTRSETNLVGVHPDLVKVMRAAFQSPQPFVVIYGVRSLADEIKAVNSGHSETLHSRHFKNKQGFGCAVDVAPLNEQGEVYFAEGNELAIYGQIAKQIKDTAEHLSVEIEWGGDPIGAWTPGVVSHFRDWGHFQLPWAVYP